MPVMVRLGNMNNNPTWRFCSCYFVAMTTIIDIMKSHKANGGHFFDKDTMRYFQSKCYPEVFGDYFITSEVSPEGEMRYTLRHFSREDWSITTVGDFFAYKNLSDAIEEARTLSGLPRKQ